MSMVRAEPPGLVRNALVCILPATLVTGAIAYFFSIVLGFEVGYLLKTMALFLVGATAVLLGLPKHHPFESFGVANQITVVRTVLVALMAALIGERTDTGSALLATLLATVVAILDGMDGWIARRTGMTSGFGARFDMETDAALIMVLSILAWQWGKAGPWVLASGLMRYLFVVAGHALPRLRTPLPPRQRRKVIAVIQMVALIATVAPWIDPSWSVPLAAIGLSALAGSFLMDIGWLVLHEPQSRTAASRCG